MSNVQSKRYLTCAESAKLVRQSLKAVFPEVKFSVRSKTYSGGASIDISWTDGPRTRRVEAIAKKFEGASFDGMIDLKSSVTREWRGEPVSFGSDYVFCSRQISNRDAKMAEAEAWVRGYYTITENKIGGYWVDDVVRGIVYAREDGMSIEDAHAIWSDVNAR